MNTKEQHKVWFYMVMQTRSTDFNKYNTQSHAKTYAFLIVYSL